MDDSNRLIWLVFGGNWFRFVEIRFGFRFDGRNFLRRTDFGDVSAVGELYEHRPGCFRLGFDWFCDRFGAGCECFGALAAEIFDEALEKTRLIDLVTGEFGERVIGAQVADGGEAEEARFDFAALCRVGGQRRRSPEVVGSAIHEDAFGAFLAADDEIVMEIGREGHVNGAGDGRVV